MDECLHGLIIVNEGGVHCDMCDAFRVEKDGKIEWVQGVKCPQCKELFEEQNTCPLCGMTRNAMADQCYPCNKWVRGLMNSWCADERYTYPCTYRKVK